MISLEDVRVVNKRSEHDPLVLPNYFVGGIRDFETCRKNIDFLSRHFETNPTPLPAFGHVTHWGVF